MEFYVNRLLYALSYALDCVEGEVFGATTYHCERVAYIAVRIGEKMGLTPDQCSSVAMRRSPSTLSSADLMKSCQANGSPCSSFVLSDVKSSTGGSVSLTC